MKKTVMAAIGCVLLFSAPSVAQMMDGHMEEMMRGMQGKARGESADKGLTQEAEAAAVTVKAAYTNPGQTTPVFNVVLDTHSVDLDGYKFGEVVVLRDEDGNIYRPAVVAESGSGHHREATLEFKDAGRSKTLTLVVKGVAGVDERVFRFEAGKEMDGGHPAGRE